MNTRAVLLVGLGTLLAGSLAGAAETYNPAEARKYIIDSETAWAQSVATSDASVVRRILADDVVWVLDGEILDKAHAVTDAAAGPGDFLSNRLEYAHVRFFGDVAVVQGAEHWMRQGGRSGRFVWTDTWLRRNGEWQIIASQDTSVADASGSSR